MMTSQENPMPATDEETTLRFAINLGNAVLAKTLPDGQPGGITVEIANKIAAQQGKVAQFVTYPTAGKVVEDATSDRWDVAFLAIDPKREEVLRFTRPYITIEGTVLVKEDSHWQSVSEMDQANVVINVGKGAAYDLFLTRELKQAALNRLASSQEAIDAFLNGEGDMAAGIRQPIVRAARENSGYRVLPDNFGQIFQAICLPHKKEKLFSEISHYLNKWQEDGAIDEIINQNLAEA
ncbi:transporter substrate-binding domain-containing protein (plasmid) [Pantoea agglomerans]|nr:transporter substrate-binding domain-containing protein [Pantoea agglomerans]WIL44336.1 transporter substrate-binding domain-containing protein [Pantoea agglomerans]